mgnify:CR=1 FL=1
MIEIKHLSKTFQMKDGAVNALKDINLTIPDGSIYGIIGMSGAGKSTLVRCINLLERPTEGSVVIDGTAMETLSPAAPAFFDYATSSTASQLIKAAGAVPVAK